MGRKVNMRAEEDDPWPRRLRCVGAPPADPRPPVRPAIAPVNQEKADLFARWQVGRIVDADQWRPGLLRGQLDARGDHQVAGQESDGQSLLGGAGWAFAGGDMVAGGADVTAVGLAGW